MGKTIKTILIVTVISVFSLFWISVIGYFFISGNLEHNAVYYAHHTPHKEGSQPVLDALDNIDRWDAPELDGVSYDFDGHTIIYVKKDGSDKKADFSISDKPCYCDMNGICYDFDLHYKLEAVFDTNNNDTKKLDVSNFDSDKVVEEIYDTFNPVINALNVEPDVNLQWIFDWYYHDRYN